jgi:hypothetical protein
MLEEMNCPNCNGTGKHLTNKDGWGEATICKFHLMEYWLTRTLDDRYAFKGEQNDY